MATVYRSVRLVILNGSNAILTVEGAQTLLGDWGALGAGGAMAPATGALPGAAGPPESVGPQSAVTLVGQSTELHIGVEGFVRFGSSLGRVHVHWQRPWVGVFSLDCEADPAHWKSDLFVLDEDPAAIAALLTLTPRIRRR